MKVTGTGQGALDRSRDIAGTNSIADSKGKRRTERAPQVDSGVADKVAISGKAKEAARAKELAQAAPDVDESKIARLKAAIQNGNYKVDADKLAERMLDDHLNNSI